MWTTVSSQLTETLAWFSLRFVSELPVSAWRCLRGEVLSPPDQEHRHLRRQIGLPFHLAMACQEVAPLHYQRFQRGQRFEIVPRQEMNIGRFVPLVGGNNEVRGARPLKSMESRPCQWPKFGNATIARRPTRSISRSTVRGWRGSCRVWLRIT